MEARQRAQPPAEGQDPDSCEASGASLSLHIWLQHFGFLAADAQPWPLHLGSGLAGYLGIWVSVPSTLQVHSLKRLIWDLQAPELSYGNLFAPPEEHPHGLGMHLVPL